MFGCRGQFLLNPPHQLVPPLRFGAVFGWLGPEVEQDQAWQIPRSLRLDHTAYSPPQTPWMGAYRYPGRGIDLGCLSICWLVTPPP
ncbi:MAG: hypothetical protein K6T61_15155 [Bryobacteraceae bacterium]|nr:hypothetical protein [Bryobacteraceae bacterium]